MIEVVGIGDDGWAGLPASSRRAVEKGDVVVGGSRHLAMLPEQLNAERRTWPSPLLSGLDALLEETRSRALVVLASGDPLRSGIGTTLVERLGVEAVRIHTAPSSEALARARMVWSAESTTVVTTVGRDLDRLRPALTPRARLVVLCSDGAEPARVAALLVEEGWPGARITAWWHLGGADEGSRTARADQWGAAPTDDLVTLCVELPACASHPQPSEGVATSPNRTAAGLGTVPGRADGVFEHDGLITKRDVRAAVLARLRPCPGERLWDLGAGSGAIAVEWCRAAERAGADAVERDPRRAQRVRENARRLGVAHRITLHETSNDEFVAALAETPARERRAPDAVFVGGGLSAEILDRALGWLEPGGRLVATAVTLESELLLHEARRQHGGEMTRIGVETMEPLGTMEGWKPARSVVIWSMTKDPLDDDAAEASTLTTSDPTDSEASA